GRWRRVFVETAGGHQLEEVKGGTVERVVATAIRRHDRESGTFVFERGAVIYRVGPSIDFRLDLNSWFGLAVRFVLLRPAVGVDLNPASAPHDLAGFGDDAPRQRLVDRRQMLVRDVEQVDVVLPAVGLLGGFVDAFRDELLSIA